jgi:hypothetical protein
MYQIMMDFWGIFTARIYQSVPAGTGKRKRYGAGREVYTLTL